MSTSPSKIELALTPIEVELNFTQTYQLHQHEHPALREAHCLRALFPHLFDPIQKGDLFAGRIHYLPVGFGLEYASGGAGYYCYAEQVREQMAQAELSDSQRQQVEEMIAFWAEEDTISGKLIPHLPPELSEATSNRIADMGGRLSGVVMDFDRLTRLGLPGLLAEVEQGRLRAQQSGGDVALYQGFRMALELLADISLDYARQARQMATEEQDEAWEIELLTMADVLEKIAVAPPETMREAAQLAWLYSLISSVVNYGRMDVYLGDFYVHDLESGILTEERALALLQSLWRLMVVRKIIFNSRVFLGGYGRRNEANADRFALLAMEATRTVIEIEPQLTLRFYAGMNPALMAKALDVIGEGRTYPMLFNDDVNVPAVMKGFGVGREAAEQYLPYGCGEYALNGLSFGSPNCGFNLLKVLEVVLHNGHDGQTGQPLGLQTGTLDSFTTYELLWGAYKRQIEFHTEKLADRHALEYGVEAQSAAWLFASLLLADCLERGKSMVDGGVRYRGGVVETFGMINAADSLAAIKLLVYDKKLMTLPELVAALDTNYEGYERQRLLLRNAPKYGNDLAYVDEIAQQVSDHISRYTWQQAQRIGFDYFLIVNINNYANVTFGKESAASADGRRNGDPLANGNTPTAGNDVCGVTAFLNSIVKLDPSYHAGYTHNMKFSKSMFRDDRPKLEALLKGYFLNGGTQAMITVVGRDDLEAAMREPEKYRNLIVRVGGFSARFVELSRDIQVDLIQRTLY